MKAEPSQPGARNPKRSFPLRLVRLFGPSLIVTAVFLVYLHVGYSRIGPPAQPLPPGVTHIGTYSYSLWQTPIHLVTRESAPLEMGGADRFGEAILQPRLQSSESWGAYTVNIYEYGNDVFDDIFEAFEIMKDREPLYTQTDHRVAVGNIGLWDEVDPKVAMGCDVTGDGKPNLVVSSHTGGNCGQWFYHVFEIGSSFRLLYAVAFRHCPADFVDLDNDGSLELVSGDATYHDYMNWYGCHAACPAPKVILRFQNGKLRLAADLMRALPPPEEELEGRISAALNDANWSLAAPSRAWYSISGIAERSWLRSWQRVRVPNYVWYEMLDLIYTGNEKAALEFYDAAWKPGYPGKSAWLKEFRAQLARSPYWPEIMEMNRDKSAP